LQDPQEKPNPLKLILGLLAEGAKQEHGSPPGLLNI